MNKFANSKIIDKSFFSIKQFFALSRTTHGILDIAMPAFCALLWLGYFPNFYVISLSLLTAFSGYTAIYALNDIVGYKIDREIMNNNQEHQGYSVESSALRHPIAQHLISTFAGYVWGISWLFLALIGAYFLNPYIILIIASATVCEIIYCKLLKVTYLRVIFSGVVKAAGPIAAIFVVDPFPSPLLLLVVFAWIFLWEIGGQNIPADYNDINQDKQINAKTIPIYFGEKMAKNIIMVTTCLTVLLSCAIVIVSPLKLGGIYILINIIIGYLLLVKPAYYLYKTNDPQATAKLFNCASYYPLALLILMALTIFLSIFWAGRSY